jgi:hypothetical protein
MECYYPLLQAAGFDLEFDEAEIFLIAKGILDDPEFSRRVDDNGDDAAEGKWLLRKYGNSRGEKDPALANVENPFKRSELQAADCANEMTPEEKLALRERVISALGFLRKKYSRP